MINERLESIFLQDVAHEIGATLLGDSKQEIEDIAPLDRATANQLSFLSSAEYASHLSTTEAAAVILRPEQQELFNGNRLLMDDPYLGYAKAASLFHPFRQVDFGVHPTATVSLSATLAAGGWVGAKSMVMAGARISEGVYIGPGCVISSGCKIGKGSRLMANISLMEDTVLGEGCIVHPGAVIGSDGFGFAQEGERWIKISQLGRVVIGDRVEIGANTTIDRGALEDTVIEDGVKIDNLVHIAHNVHIGENCAMAAMVGVAGSSTIGAGSTFGGQAGVVGHIHIAPGTHCTARTFVAQSIEEPGVYSSGTPADTNRRWRRNTVQFKKLNESIQRLRAVEKKLGKIEMSEKQEPQE